MPIAAIRGLQQDQRNGENKTKAERRRHLIRRSARKLFRVQTSRHTTSSSISFYISLSFIPFIFSNCHLFFCGLGSELIVFWRSFRLIREESRLKFLYSLWKFKYLSRHHICIYIYILPIGVLPADIDLMEEADSPSSPVKN